MEADMTVRMVGTVAHLEGDWTMTGVADNLDSLVLSLNQLEFIGEKNIQINCGQIEETDTSGLQLLYVWVECARLRGIEPKLVNVTDRMRRAIHEFGFSQSFSDTYSEYYRHNP
jgi:anti-anti-sigma regulatory factor